MRSCYVEYLSPVKIAIADLCDYYGEGMIITRINTPIAFRGKGYGNTLLKRITADADAEGIVLFLEISPSDGLSFEQLKAWYLRNGFAYWKGIYRRLPQTPKGKSELQTVTSLPGNGG